MDGAFAFIGRTYCTGLYLLPSCSLEILQSLHGRSGPVDMREDFLGHGLGGGPFIQHIQNILCWACAGGVPVPVVHAVGAVAAGAAAAGHGRGGADPLLAAALPDLQADVGPAADPGAARAGARCAAAAAQRRHLPVGPRHPDAPLQHPLHARHLPPHRHAPHPGTTASLRNSWMTLCYTVSLQRMYFCYSSLFRGG